MILSDLNYLSPVREKNRIVGGAFIQAETSITYTSALAHAGPDGEQLYGLASGSAIAAGGYETSTTTLITTKAYDYMLPLAKASASAHSTSSGPEGDHSAYSFASHDYTTIPDGTISWIVTVSLAMST